MELANTRTGPFFHVAVHDGRAAKEEKNLTADDVLRRVAIPHQLQKKFRVDGYEVDPLALKRLRITRTAEHVDVAAVMNAIDGSSLSNLFGSLLTASQKLTEGEDVTDDILKQADQDIASRGLVAEKRGAFDVPILSDKAFAAMSFASELEQSFEAIAEACSEAGVKATRADKEISSAVVMDRVILHLKEANYVVADLTNARPNVYYEIGFFDAICAARGVDAARHLLLVVQEGHAADFNLKHRGIESYDNPYTLRKIAKNWFRSLKG